ncbi:MAG: sulfotransferase, partial [Calditrichaceae bacterium]
MSQWYNILQNEKTSINWSYFYRVLPTTLKSLANSLLAQIEKQKYQTKYEKLTIKPPIFILGHWRSGTTLLQNILSNDYRFTSPNLYQTTNPKTFLVSEETVITKLFSYLVPKHRLFDHVPFGLKSPHEDEFIAWHSSGLTSYMGWNFPNAAKHFDRYLTFRAGT